MYRTRLMMTLAAVAALTAGASATVLTYDLSVEFSGATPPAGAGPWMQATFDDSGTPGSVTLTLSNIGLVDAEFVRGWYFNLDPIMDPTALNISASTQTGSFDDPTVSTGVDAFQADGDGLYDVLLGFSTSGQGGGSRRFGAGEEAVFNINGIPGLTASSFSFDSAPAGGAGPFPTAAKVQGIGPGASGSGWVTVPEPVTLVLLGVGGLGLLRNRHRRAC